MVSQVHTLQQAGVKLSTITFEQLCPTWNLLLYPEIKQKAITKLVPDLGNWKKCVVGEAYGLKDKYVDQCAWCYIYAVKFHSEAAKEATYDKQFEPIKVAFAEHWNDKHLGQEVIQQ